MTETIIALDPGGTTGWASWTSKRLLPETFGDNPWVHFSCSQIGPQEHHEELYAHLGQQCVDDTTVVCESFEFRLFDGNRTGINLISREYIGVAKLFVKEYKLDRPLVLQSPGQAKPFVTNEKLKAMGLYVRGQGHAMDAMRHLIFYMVNRRRRLDLIETWKDL